MISKNQVTISKKQNKQKNKQHTINTWLILFKLYFIAIEKDFNFAVPHYTALCEY